MDELLSRPPFLCFCSYLLYFFWIELKPKKGKKKTAS